MSDVADQIGQPYGIFVNPSTDSQGAPLQPGMPESLTCYGSRTSTEWAL